MLRSPARSSPRRTRATPPRRTRAALGAMVLPLSLALGAVAAPVAAAEAGSTTSTGARQAGVDRAALYDLLDDARVERGLAPLRRDPAVERVAQRWAERMAASGSLAHNLDLRGQLPAGASGGGENVGRGTLGAPVAVHEAWLASPGHRANALSGSYDTVGVGVAHDSRGRLWTAVDFGTYG